MNLLIILSGREAPPKKNVSKTSPGEIVRIN